MTNWGNTLISWQLLVYIFSLHLTMWPKRFHRCSVPCFTHPHTHKKKKRKGNNTYHLELYMLIIIFLLLCYHFNNMLWLLLLWMWYFILSNLRSQERHQVDEIYDIRLQPVSGIMFTFPSKLNANRWDQFPLGLELKLGCRELVQ